MPHTTPPSAPMRVFLLGGTGTMGLATKRALLAQGHSVVSFERPGVRTVPPVEHPS